MYKQILFIFIFSIFSLNLYSACIDFYPNIKPINNYVSNLRDFIVKKKKVDDKFLIIRDEKIFISSEQILDAVQNNIIQFAIVPIKDIIKLDIKGDITKFIKTFYSMDIPPDVDSGDFINFRLKLSEYNLFPIDVMQGGKYFLFSEIPNIGMGGNSKVNLAVIYNFFLESYKNFFSNTLVIDNAAAIADYIKSNLFNSAIITTIDYDFFKMELPNVYDLSLKSEKYCLIANYYYWNNLPDANKLLIWSFVEKNGATFDSDIKSYQDKILNKLYIKKIQLK